jgi:hypothetical protein
MRRYVSLHTQVARLFFIHDNRLMSLDTSVSLQQAQSRWSTEEFFQHLTAISSELSLEQNKL